MATLALPSTTPALLRARSTARRKIRLGMDLIALSTAVLRRIGTGSSIPSVLSRGEGRGVVWLDIRPGSASPHCTSQKAASNGSSRDQQK